MSKVIYVIGTCDTKQEELTYTCGAIRASGEPVRLVDVGTQSSGRADITNEEVASHHPDGREAVLTQTDRNKALEAMGLALVQFLANRSDLGGVIGTPLLTLMAYSIV